MHRRATALLRDKPAEAAPLLQAGLGKGIVDTATFERALASPASKFVADPERIRAATGVMQDFQIHLGVLDRPADLDSLFDPALYRAAEAGQGNGQGNGQ
jgi:NitT/TauT family transport system substrate-binding protein